jgi:hypothetical protein
MRWNYDAKDYSENDFELLPVGDYRVRIEKAEETKSKTGKDMIKLELKVSGHRAKLFHYLVLDPTDVQRTNQRLGELFHSFKITPGDMNYFRWIGHVGAVRVKHASYQGEQRADVSYCLALKKQETLPPWVESPQKAPFYPNISSMRDDPDFFNEPPASSLQEGSSDCPF